MSTGERLRRVTRIDVAAGVVWRHYWPLRMDLSTGDAMAEYPTHFRSIHPIHAGSFRP